MIRNILFTICFIGSLSFSLNGQNDNHILIEEFTGTWCGLCPGGMAFMNQLMEEYEEIIPVYLHIGDIMETSSTFELGSSYTGGGVPAFLIERYLFESYPFVTM